MNMALSVTVRFSGPGSYEVGGVVESLRFEGIKFARNTLGFMFRFHEGTKNVTFVGCTFEHADPDVAAISVADNFTHPTGLALTFEDCKFTTTGPALAAAIQRDLSTKSTITFVNCEFRGGDGTTGNGKLTFEGKLGSTLAVSVEQVTRGQIVPPKTFDGVNVGEAALIRSENVALTLSNVDFASIAANAAVRATGSAAVDVRNCRFNSVTGGGLNILGPSSVAIDGGSFVDLSGFAVQVDANPANLSSGNSSLSVTNSEFRNCRGRSVVLTRGVVFSRIVVSGSTFVESGDINGVVDLTSLPSRMSPLFLIDKCRFERCKGAQAIDVQGARLVNVSSTVFVDNVVQVSVQVRAPLTLDNVTFSNSSTVADAYVETGDPVIVRGVDASKGIAPTILRTVGGSVEVRGPAVSLLRSIEFPDAQSTLTLSAVTASLLLCNGATAAGPLKHALNNGAVTIGADAMLTMYRGVDCDAFSNAGGAIENNGALVLRVTGSDGFVINRTITGTGSLKLGIRGSGSNVGEVDRVTFAKAPTFSRVDVVVTLTSVLTNGTVIPLATFPAGSTFGNLSSGVEQNMTALTFKVIISCAVSCNMGRCVAKDTCACNDGFQDSEAGKCNARITQPTTSGERSLSQVTSGSTTSGAQIVPDTDAGSPSLPIEIIAPAVAGGVLLLVVVGVAICCIVRRRDAHAQNASIVKEESPYGVGMLSVGNDYDQLAKKPAYDVLPSPDYVDLSKKPEDRYADPAILAQT